MLRRIAIVAALIVWIAANLLFFYWYHQLIGLSFSLPSAIVIIIASAWFFSIAYFVPRLAVRFFLSGTVAIILAWTLVNFAYFKIFGTFLPLTSSRLMSLNLPMLRLVHDFAYTVPLPLSLAALGLVIYYFAIGRLLKIPKEDEMTVLFASAENQITSISFRKKFKKTFITIGVATQLGVFLLMSATITDIRRDARATDPTTVLSKIGLIGFALASGADPGPQSENGVARPKENNFSSLSGAKGNIASLRESLAKLNSDAEKSANLKRPVPPKTPHLIFYQMESADSWPLYQNPTPMPFLASLMEKYGTVNDYFANGCTTVDAEFSINCGFLPETYGPVSDLYSKNSYNCLPSILKDKGYRTSIYHANDSSFWARATLAPAWGFDNLNFEPVFKNREPDSAIFDRVVSDLKAANEPTMQYVIGMTGHAPHDEHFQRFYNDSYHLDVQPYAGELNLSSQAMNIDEPTLRLYLGFLKATDNGLKHLFDRLTQEGLLDETVVIIYGDHRYYQASSGNAEKDFLLYNRIPMVIAMPNAEKIAWPKIASHLDIAPTIYDYLTSGKETLPPTFLGTSLFSSAHANAAINKCLGRASYYDGNTLADNNVSLRTFKITNFRGTTTSDKQTTIENELASIASASDLLFARNLLHENAIVSSPDAEVGAPLPEQNSADANTDTDHDGLSDLREKALGTDRNNPDTDGDGFTDGNEVMNGFDPLGPGKKLMEN